MKALLTGRNIVYVNIPGVQSPPWPERIRKAFKKNMTGLKSYDNPEEDYIFLELDGTTFSGHSTKTTLGNTLRSLCY